MLIITETLFSNGGVEFGGDDRAGDQDAE